MVLPVWFALAFAAQGPSLEVDARTLWHPGDISRF